MLSIIFSRGRKEKEKKRKKRVDAGAARTKEFGLGVECPNLFVVEPVVAFYHSTTGPQFDLNNMAMLPPAVILDNWILTLIYMFIAGLTYSPIHHV